MILKQIEQSARYLAKSANGNPIITTGVIFLFYLAFSLFEEMMELLIFGDRFEHWLDPLFIGVFIAYSAYAVYACAIHNSDEPLRGTRKLEDEIVRLRAYVQRGCDLLHSLAGDEEIDQYRERAEKVLKETLPT